MNAINSIRGFLSGKKTYIVAILAGVALVSARLDWITPEQLALALEFLGVGVVITLRSAISRR